MSEVLLQTPADTHVEREATPVALRFDYEEVGTTEDIELRLPTFTRADGSKLSFVALKDDPEGRIRQAEYAHAVAELGYEPTLLPAHNDVFSPEEATFYTEYLGVSRARLNHPFRPVDTSNNPDGREIVFFQPSATTVIDMARMLGNDSSDMRALRLAAHHDTVDQPQVQALQIAVELAGINLYSLYDGNITPEQQALVNVFGAGKDITYLVEGLATHGMDLPKLQSINRLLEGGFDPEFLSTIAQGGEEVQDLVKTIFDSVYEYGSTHGGSYMEVHKVGDAYIPLPALVDTSYGSPYAFGTVGESSGHNLAQIYHDMAESRYGAAAAEFVGVADRSGLNEFILRTGLGCNTTNGTLLQRGRIQKLHGEYVYTIRQHEGEEIDLEGEVQQVIAGLAEYGIKTQIKTESSVFIVDAKTTDAVGSVSNKITWVSVPAEHRTSRYETLPKMILNKVAVGKSITTGEDAQGHVVETSTGVKLEWLEGDATRHDVLYKVAGKDETHMETLTLGADSIGIIGHFDTKDGKPRLHFMLDASDEAIKRQAASIKKVANSAAHNIGQTYDVQVAVEVYARSGSNTPWKRVVLNN